MTPPGGGSPATDEPRREWLQRLDAAAQKVLDDLQSSDDPILRQLAEDVEHLSVRLQHELQVEGEG